MDKNISVEISQSPLHPAIPILHIKGFVYATTLAKVEEALQPLLTAQNKKMIFDLSETNYVSSGGWGLFSGHSKRLQEQGGGLVFVGMKPEVHDSFELLEMHQNLRTAPTLESAFRDGFGTTSSLASKAS